MYKTLHGLVLREVRYKESSKILTILTEEEGKITAEAKGVLRKGSKCAASAQALVWSELTVSEYRGRYTLTEGSVAEDFSALRSDLENYALGCYFAELMETVSDEDSPDPALLHLGLNALFALSRKLYEARHIKAVFELRLLCLAGFAPSLDRCAVCGREEPEQPRLSLYGGSVRCAGCEGIPAERSAPLCPASLAAMRYTVGADAKKIYSFTLDEAAAARFQGACEEFALAQLDRGFRTLEYWKGIQQAR
ncbi:MAG: DNA repair protein RecO [Oscillospiraceae bacterium]|nr:DNA repair protein RecO [Oscillospiraceae bacterium]